MNYEFGVHRLTIRISLERSNISTGFIKCLLDAKMFQNVIR